MHGVVRDHEPVMRLDCGRHRRQRVNSTRRGRPRRQAAGSSVSCLPDTGVGLLLGA